VDRALEAAASAPVPLNSLEGFLRQVIGWREFVRAVYERVGVPQRTANFWGADRPLPASFYDGTTGIAPVDRVIRQVLDHAWCHHIERLMILGNFMCLCGFRPDAVCRWFLELFIDGYDWVMVPNVHGMALFADGGLMTTKPYLSGSNYIRKMSQDPPGPWCATWDALFWRFIGLHRDFFAGNPRLSMMTRQWDRMPPDRRHGHLDTAERFLDRLG
jgi:deoxyribodipyrimidine photolyase-related protein